MGFVVVLTRATFCCKWFKDVMGSLLILQNFLCGDALSMLKRHCAVQVINGFVLYIDKQGLHHYLLLQWITLPNICKFFKSSCGLNSNPRFEPMTLAGDLDVEPS